MKSFLRNEKLEILDVIDRDIDRCFPTHRLFRVAGGTAFDFLLFIYFPNNYLFLKKIFKYIDNKIFQIY